MLDILDYRFKYSCDQQMYKMTHLYQSLIELQMSKSDLQ